MPNSFLQAGVTKTRYNRYNLPVVTADWSRGVVRDAPRDAIPQNALFDATDFLLHEPGLMFKRGGTSYAGPALTGASYAATVTEADFPAGNQLIAIGDNGHMYKITAGATTDLATLGTGFPPLQTPVLRVGATTYLVVPASDGTTVPKTYDGTTVANLGGSPSAGRYACVYKTRLVLANQAANPNRMFFSPTPSITSTWDTTNSWIDADNAISGLAALSNAIIIFSQDHTERLTGSTPPPNSDMDRQPIGSIGCTDARSIVIQEGNAIFANPRGVYLTNGAGFQSLTTAGLIETYWQSLMVGYDPTTWTIACGVFRSFLFVTIMNGSTLVDSLVCYVPRYAWARLTNWPALMYATAFGNAEELYYADRSTNRVVACSGVFRPASGNKNDANGTAVAPACQFRLVGSGPWMKHFGNGRITYDMRDAATDNPTLAAQVAANLEATSYGTVAESPFAESSDLYRQRFTVAKQSQAVNVKLAQTGPSAKTEIYSLEVDQRYIGVYAGGT
jgi:hypothetical protein